MAQQKQKELALDLSGYVDKTIKAKLHGGREVSGVLKGYDQMLNLVVDETVEYLRDPEDPGRTTEQTRQLGLVVCRGSAVVAIAPAQGLEEIANPFLVQEDS